MRERCENQKLHQNLDSKFIEKSESTCASFWAVCQNQFLGVPLSRRSAPALSGLSAAKAAAPWRPTAAWLATAASEAVVGNDAWLATAKRRRAPQKKFQLSAIFLLRSPKQFFC
jgi:hypothetical protein